MKGFLLYVNVMRVRSRHAAIFPYFLRTFFLLFFLFACSFVEATPTFLKPHEAFALSLRMKDPSTIEAHYQIADGYYLYRERFHFDAQQARLDTPLMPNGQITFDETFQKNVEVYRHGVTIDIPVQAHEAFMLSVTAQGCSDKGLCYAPFSTQAKLSPDSSAASPRLPQRGDTATSRNLSLSEMGRIERTLHGGQMIAVATLFFLLGLGLSFTPCVLPMLPILSTIIMGEENVTKKRGFLLALAYSLGMAIVYTLLGIAAGLLGESLAATLQNPWVLGAFALLMTGLALSMFDLYPLQMPAFIQHRLSDTSRRQRRGKWSGVFVMGALSALIVGPCVAAPLAGALLYISQTRDVMLGAGALFSMAMGMSVPLWLLGLSAGVLLPRTGAWMHGVKHFFGVLMLAVALWMVSPVMPAAVLMSGWMMLGLGYGGWLIWKAHKNALKIALGSLFLAGGVLQLAGLATGGRDALTPLAHLRAKSDGTKLVFTRIKTVDDLERVLQQTDGKPVMLDFYADWCVACIEMEKLTFTQPQVRARLNDVVLLQVDVTKNDAHDKAMLRRYNLFGPPGIVFFDGNGKEVHGSRVIGFQNAPRFLQSLDVVLGKYGEV